MPRPSQTGANLRTPRRYMRNWRPGRDGSMCHRPSSLLPRPQPVRRTKLLATPTRPSKYVTLLPSCFQSTGPTAHGYMRISASANSSRAPGLERGTAEANASRCIASRIGSWWMCSNSESRGEREHRPSQNTHIPDGRPILPWITLTEAFGSVNAVSAPAVKLDATGGKSGSA